MGLRCFDGRVGEWDGSTKRQIYPLENVSLNMSSDENFTSINWHLSFFGHQVGQTYY